MSIENIEWVKENVNEKLKQGIEEFLRNIIPTLDRYKSMSGEVNIGLRDNGEEVSLGIKYHLRAPLLDPKYYEIRIEKEKKESHLKVYLHETS